MNQVGKHLAKSLTIHLNTKIKSLVKKDGWELLDEYGQIYNNFDWVISTVPSPQVEKLLPKFFKQHNAIKAVDMRASFSLMLGFEKSLSLDFEAAHVTNTDLSWIGVNSHKPGRGQNYTLMIHSSADYADAHINDDRVKVMQHLINETSCILGQDVSVANYKNIHGWRYANNAKRQNYSVFLDKNQKLAACGDWCLGGRVEGSFTSAYNLVKALKENAL
jgi:predicted NAD/FAD-dependent oxidoreductase